jgi:hypothetical protein
MSESLPRVFVVNNKNKCEVCLNIITEVVREDNVTLLYGTAASGWPGQAIIITE